MYSLWKENEKMETGKNKRVNYEVKLKSKRIVQQEYNCEDFKTLDVFK